MKDQEQKNFLKSLGISLLLHIFFACLFIFGIPSFKTPVAENNVIVFEMLPVDDIVNVKNQTPNPAKEPEIQETKRVKKSEPDTPKPEEIKPQEIKEEVKPEVAKEEPKKEAEVVPDNKLAEKKPESEKQEKKPQTKPKPKPEETEPKKSEKEKPKPKKIPKKQEDVIDSILKTLEKESDGQEVKSQNTGSSSASEGKFAKGSSYDDTSPLSVTEKLLIRQQIEKNWRPPVGATDMENVQVILHLKIKPDGVITEAVIKDVICPPGAKGTCDLVADSAVRAARKASPFENLRPNRYDAWKEFDLRFDPSNIGR